MQFKGRFKFVCNKGVQGTLFRLAWGIQGFFAVVWLGNLKSSFPAQILDVK